MNETRTPVDCAIVVVTYNSGAFIGDLLASIPDSTPEMTTRVVVVDNASADATCSIVRSWRDVSLISTGANLGYSAAINIGRTAIGQCSALLVLNPDVVLESGAIEELVRCLDDTAVGVAAPTLLDENGDLTWSVRREPTLMRALGDGLFGSRFKHRPAWLSDTVRREAEYGIRHSIDWATGAVLLISGVCNETVGDWDEQFFLYSEETDYAARARAAGFRVEFQPSAKVRHRGKGSGNSAELSALMAINRVRYIEKKLGRWPRFFRSAVVLTETLRSYRRRSRVALGFLLRRSSWPSLVADLKFPAGSADPVAASQASQRTYR